MRARCCNRLRRARAYLCCKLLRRRLKRGYDDAESIVGSRHRDGKAPIADELAIFDA